MLSYWIRREETGKISRVDPWSSQIDMHMCTSIDCICTTHKMKQCLTWPKYVLEKLIQQLSSYWMPIHWGLVFFPWWQWMERAWNLGLKCLLYCSVSTKPCLVLAMKSENPGVCVRFRHSHMFRFLLHKNDQIQFYKVRSENTAAFPTWPPFYSKFIKLKTEEMGLQTNRTKLDPSKHLSLKDGLLKLQTG